MPTGYTAIIEEGCTFEDYILRCARGMGALITMRDMPMDAPIPDVFEPSPFYKDELEKAKKEYEALCSMTVPEIERAAIAQYQNRKKGAEEGLAKEDEINKRYERIRAEVEAWVPPTPDHDGLKRFMLEQIDLCTRNKMSSYYAQRLMELREEKVDAQKWFEARKKDLLDSVERYARKWEEEKERCAERTKWVQELKKSLNLINK